MATAPTLPAQHKAGDTFTRLFPIPAEFADGYFVAWTVASQVRSEDGTLMSSVTCEWLDALTTRNLKLRVADTRSWKPGRAEIDVQFTRVSDGEVMSTTTATFTVTRDVTQPVA